MRNHHIELGKRGEALAVGWYRSQGYKILEQNWRCREGEIDIIALDKDAIIFCEVKTRSTPAFGLPSEAVTQAKQQKLRNLALTFMSQDATPHRKITRFDVACVMDEKIEVIKGAF